MAAIKLFIEHMAEASPDSSAPFKLAFLAVADTMPLLGSSAW